MKVQEAINHANALTGQAVEQDTQLRWLSELDGQLALEMYRAHIWQPYTEDDLGAALLVPYPWDGLYVHHLEAMAYYSRGEYERYNNSLAMRERTLKEFQAFVQRTKKRCGEITIAQAGDGGSGIVTVTGDDVWRYISAYGVALLHGFTGTPEEWLESLVGAQGPQGEPGEAGPKGDTGAAGAQGPKGDKGDKGDTGEAGAQGPKGDKGDKGDTGDTGATGPKGEDGADGVDGVSPAVTVTDITDGHRVTITDKDHPSGVSFDVLNGSGDMTAAVYDAQSAVAQAGGIASFVSSAVATHAANGDIHTTAAEKATWDAKADAADIPAPSDAAPAMDGTASAGVSAAYSRGDHVHPTDTSRAAASALAAHIADKANPHEVTKAQVGLGSVDNTSDADKPVSAAQAAALALKAPLASPALTGTPTAPTAPDGTATAQLATTAFVQSANKWHSNPNLLDNCYFVGGGSQQGGGQFPINQRGGYIVPSGTHAYADGTGADMGVLTSAVTVTEIIPSNNVPRFYLNGILCYSEPNTYVPGYTGTGYGIDRWISSGLVELNPQGISLSANATIFQRLGETQDLINGRIVTASILFDDKFFSGTITYQKAPAQNIVFVTNSSVSLLIGVDGDFYVINGNSIINACVAVKLELGDTQTLAHQENGVWVLNEVTNYQEQLARCQRHQVLIPFIIGNSLSTAVSDGNGECQFPIYLPTTPRAASGTFLLKSGQLRVHGQGIEYSNVTIGTTVLTQGNIATLLTSNLTPLELYTLDAYPGGEFLLDFNPS